MANNIRTSSKIIAEFDGGHEYYISNMWTIKNHGLIHINDFKYHSSWDWQIPVWNKIYDLCARNFNLTKYYEQETVLHSAIRLNKPDMSIPYLINIIEWYNQQQNEHGKQYRIK